MNEHLHIQALTRQRDALAREVSQLRAENRELKTALYGHALTDDELDTFLTVQDARAMATQLAEPPEITARRRRALLETT
jgi:cell division septum initiation protein DivIVA